LKDLNTTRNNLELASEAAKSRDIDRSLIIKSWCKEPDIQREFILLCVLNISWR